MAYLVEWTTAPKGRHLYPGRGRAGEVREARAALLDQQRLDALTDGTAEALQKCRAALLKH